MTIKEIAKLAGVSISTVSKIINNKDENINPQTRSRVLQIVKEYNYTPYGTVKNISSAKNFLLGVLLNTSHQFSLFVNGILKTAQEHGYTILLLDSQEDEELEAKHITVLCRNHVDGVIWEPVSDRSCELGVSLEKQNIPFLFINAPKTVPSYSIDFERLGYILTEKLIQYKHTSLACLLKEKSRRSEALYKGFQKCLYDYQIPCTGKKRFYVTDEDYCQNILERNITGIVSSHFASSLLLYEQMSKLHYYMPSDFSLVSLKTDVREAISYPHISSIPVPYYEFGEYVAAQLIRLCEKMEEETPAYRFIPPVTLDSEQSLDRPSSLRTRRFIVVGAINLDITFNVNHLPRHGDTTVILNSTTTAGGKGTNEAVGVAKLGHEVALIGEMGTDVDSTILFDMLEKEHVITQGIHRDKRQPTGKAYIYTESNGESAISILSGANGNLTPEDIEHRQYLFHNAGYCLISTEIPIMTAVCAARTAKTYGVRTIVKPAALSTLPAELLQNTDILVPNRKEASVFCPKYSSVEEQAEFFLAQGPEIVIITLGHNGCYLRTADTARYFEAADVVAIDTTGGADAFIAALASYLSEGYPLEKAIRIATYAAGFCVSRQGTVSALTDRNTLETHITKKESSLLV